MKKAAVILTGSELVRARSGKDVSYLDAELNDLGFEAEFHTAESGEDGIKDLLGFVFPRADLIISVGGLGAEPDDKTACALSSFTGKKLTLSREALRAIAEIFINKGQDMPKSADRAAYVLDGATIYPNPEGISVPQMIKHREKIIIMLPGKHTELKNVFARSVHPFLSKKFTPLFFRRKKLHITGMEASEIDQKIKTVMDIEHFSGLDLHFELVQLIASVAVEFTLKGGNELLVEESARRLEKEFRDIFGDSIYGQDSQSISQAVVKLLSKKRRALSSAESCTGGEIANQITNVKGASAFFDMGLVTYTEKSKSILLGIPEESLKKAGVVSEETAVMMAEALLKLSGSYYGVATTGVAGPGPSGGVRQGTVFIALASLGAATKCVKCVFPGNRLAVKKRAAVKALDIVRRELLTV
ncbi:MAG: nicotinamide-nucleotide amidohydrolase family protein [Elusimicrobiota bacterium]|nr:nicotinamide-nucleotide amidohydrolase family protein [Elusimicrobiota bacterium]